MDQISKAIEIMEAIFSVEVYYIYYKYEYFNSILSHEIIY